MTSARTPAHWHSLLRSAHGVFALAPWCPLCAILIEDLNYARRILFRNPLFTSVAILTLAIGIGATTAVFSVVDRVLFRSLPYAHPDQLVSWGFTGPIDQNEFMLGRNYVEWQKRWAPFQSVTSMSPSIDAEGDLGDRNPIRVRSIPVEANFLRTLGVTPALGRDFTREDDLPGAPRVALLSCGLWQSRFAGIPQLSIKASSWTISPRASSAFCPRTSSFRS